MRGREPSLDDIAFAELDGKRRIRALVAHVDSPLHVDMAGIDSLLEHLLARRALDVLKGARQHIPERLVEA